MLLQLESAHLWDAYIDQQDALPIGTIGAQETLGIGEQGDAVILNAEQQ